MKRFYILWGLWLALGIPSMAQNDLKRTIDHKTRARLELLVTLYSNTNINHLVSCYYSQTVVVVVSAHHYHNTLLGFFVAGTKTTLLI